MGHQLPARTWSSTRRTTRPRPGRSWSSGYEYNRGYTFIVHPPLGKQLIAIGEQLFGYDSFGWRLPSAVAGTIAVVVLTRLARRLTGSTLLGLVAGLLLALDGFSFSLGRIGLLDVFLQMFVVSAVACLAVDRDRVRAADPGRRRATGRTGFRARPPRLADRRRGAVRLRLRGQVERRLLPGLLRLLSLWEDRSAWREAGVARPTAVALRRGLPGAAWALGALPVLTYLATFTGWFRGENSQGRHWADQHPDTAFPFVPGRCARCGTCTASG